MLGVNSEGYVDRTNTEFKKIGVLGTTLLAASGDAGAHGKTDIGCGNPLMFPNYPSASPYVSPPHLLAHCTVCACVVV